MQQIVLHRLADEADEAPGPRLPIAPDRIEGLAHIRAVARRHEALQVEVEILPADTRLEGPLLRRVDVGQEGKPEIERILVDRCDSGLAESAVVLELHEQLPMRVEMRVGMDLQPLQEMRIRPCPTDAEARRIEALEALAQRHA